VIAAPTLPGLATGDGANADAGRYSSPGRCSSPSPDPQWCIHHRPRAPRSAPSQPRPVRLGPPRPPGPFPAGSDVHRSSPGPSPARPIRSVHRAAQDQAVQRVHPLDRTGVRRGHPRPRHPQGREPEAGRHHREARRPPHPRPARPQCLAAQFARLYADRGLEQRRRLAVPDAGQEPVGPRQQVAAGHVPGRDRRGRVPAGRR
jgi:hypothetical protein